MKHLDCLGDSRKTKDIRKIKLRGLKACCVTLIGYSISHNFPPENVEMKSLKVSLKKLLIVKIKNNTPTLQS